MGASRVIIVLLMLVAPLSVLADLPPEPNFFVIDSDDGLPHDSIEALLQDRHGFIWIGTQGGLARWDGHRMRLYRHDRHDPDSLPGSHVRDLVEDRAGNIWVATLSGGVARIDGGTGRVERVGPEQGLADPHVSALAVAPDGGIWAAHPAAGLSRIDPLRMTATPRLRSWGEDNDRPGAHALAADTEGLWIGSGPGLDFLPWGAHQARTVELPKADSDSDYRGITSIALGPDREVLVAGGAGLWRGSREANSLTRVPLPLEGEVSPSLSAIARHEDGTIWLSSRHGLFSIPPDGEPSHLGAASPGEAGLPVQVLRTALIDRQGLLWLGSEAAGLIRALPIPPGLDVHRLQHGGNTVSIWALARDEQRSWVGTERDGVLALDAEGRLQRAWLYDADRGQGENIWSLATGGQGGWVGTDEQELHLIADGGVEDRSALLADIRLSRSAALWDLLEDSQGRLWISTNGDGLHRWDPGSEVVSAFRADQSEEHGLGSDRVTVLHEDSRGRIWVGTEGDGLYVWLPDQRRFRHIPVGPRGLPGGVIEAIRHDQQGRVWVATYDGGVARLSPDGEIRVFGQAEGLPSDVVVGLEVDAEDRVWVMTSTGLARIDPDGRLARLGAAQGLPELTFHAGAHGLDPAGRPLFGAADGILVVDPAVVTVQEVDAPLRLTALRVMGEDRWRGGDNDQAVWTEGSLRLAHEQTALSLDFALLDYRDPRSHQYRYRLLGQDDDWQYTDATRPTATYTNLDPGDYRFELAVRDASGAWRELDAPLLIELPAAPWRRPEAMLAYAIFTVFALTGLFILWRRRGLRERALQREREQRQWIEQLHELSRRLAEPADRSRLLDRFLSQLLAVLPVEAAAVRLERYGNLPPTRVTRSREGKSPLSSQDAGVMALPLETRRRHLGQLHLRPLAGRPLKARDRAAVSAFTDQAAQALDTALLVAEADAANRAKTAFLAKLSHEIRTPVSGILGLADLLLRESLDERSRDYARAIASSGRSLMAILSDILDNARLEAGRMEIHPAPFDLVAAVEDTAALHAGQASAKGLAVVTHIDRELPARVVTDEVRLRQILGNLLSNATKFTTEGAITVELDRFDAERLRMSVADTGPGMTDEAVERLFQPFARAHEVAQVDGTGLGLVICRELARLMGGEIRLDTEPGAGSRFEVIFRAESAGGKRALTRSTRRFTILASPGPAGKMIALRLSESGLEVRLETALDRNMPADEIVLVCDEQGLYPREKPEWRLDWPIREARLAELLDRLSGLEAVGGKEEPSSAAVESSAQGARVLVAEDNPVNARVISDVLETAGYQLHLVGDGRSVLAAVQAWQPAVVLMDRHLPDMDGLAATRALREQGYTELPVIGLTAAISSEEHAECRRAGMDRVVVKDGNPGPMLEALRQALLGALRDDSEPNPATR